MSMKNSNDTSWDRTSDLPICSRGPPMIITKPVINVSRSACKATDIYVRLYR